MKSINSQTYKLPQIALSLRAKRYYDLAFRLLSNMTYGGVFDLGHEIIEKIESQLKEGNIEIEDALVAIHLLIELAFNEDELYDLIPQLRRIDDKEYIEVSRIDFMDYFIEWL